MSNFFTKLAAAAMVAVAGMSSFAADSAAAS